MNNLPQCYGCQYLRDLFGNYVECGKLAEYNRHLFVDYFYWNSGCPKECPLLPNPEKANA